MRTRVRTLTLVGTGCHVTRRRRTSQGRLLIGTPRPWSAASRTARSSRRWKSSLPDHLVGPVEEELVVLEGGEHEHRAALPALRDSLTQRAAAQLGRVVVEHVAHVGRLVEHEALRARRPPGSRSIAPRKSYSRGLSSLVCWSARPRSSVSRMTPVTAAARASGCRIQPVTSRAIEQEQQRHGDQEVAHLEQLAVVERHEQQEHDRGDRGDGEDDRLARAAAAEQQQREQQEQRPHRGQQLGDAVGVVAPERPGHVRDDGVEGQVVVGPAGRAERRRRSSRTACGRTRAAARAGWRARPAE